MLNRIPIATQNPTRDQSARDTAYAKVSWPVNLAPANVSYHCHGHLLIIGNEVNARLAARVLQYTNALASITLLITEKTSSSEIASIASQAYEETAELPCYQTRHIQLTGYLGAFHAEIGLDDGQDKLNLARACIERDTFDLILDLGSTAQLDLQLLPPGYHTASWGSTACDEALKAIADSVGEFEKPRYFQIDYDLCAHAGRGKAGCTRCLDVCPADAISSTPGRIESKIEIDPFRCHGVGSCTSACPTGAIQYMQPQPQRQLAFVKRLLDAYRRAGGTNPVVRFADQAWLEQQASPTAGHILDVPLEELGAAGQEHWLAALADGAAEVRIQKHAELPTMLASLIDEQLTQSHALLLALGHDTRRIRLLDEATVVCDTPACLPALVPREIDHTEIHIHKRDRLNSVITHLAEQGQPSGRREPMPAGAPFGTVMVENEACTLCMACVAVCPTPALVGGDDVSPRLSFREADCIQCGLCENACPESAITLQPGFLADLKARDTRRICKEEAPFECISCGKPFATTSTIVSIKNKLADHPYFSGNAQLRLEMCEDCRVKDVWRELAHDPNAQMKV